MSLTGENSGMVPRINFLCTVIATILIGWHTALPAHASRYALLVGVTQYETPMLTPLRYTENDMEDMARVLSTRGFLKSKITVLTGQEGRKDKSLRPTAANIETHIDQILGKVKQGDVVIVGFSGHGVEFADDPGNNYFCPSDADLAQRDSLIPLKRIFDRLEKCQASGRLLLVDACRDSPPVDRSKSGGKGIRLANISDRQPPILEGGTIAYFSCSGSQKSYEAMELEHGVFFHYVIEGLKGDADFSADGAVTAQELGLFTINRVKTYASQKLKQIQTPCRTSGREITGEIILVEQSSPKDGTLRRAIDMQVQRIAKELKKLDTTRVSLAPVDAPKSFTGTGLVSQTLEERLAAHGIEITSDASQTAHPKLILEPLGAGRKLEDIQFLLELRAGASTSSNGDPASLANVSRVSDVDDLQQIINVPIATHRLGDDAEKENSPDGRNASLYRKDMIRGALTGEEKSVFLRKNRVSSGEDHDFEMALYRTSSREPNPSRDSYRIVPVSYDRRAGIATADLSRDDRIAVMIFNNTGKRVAVDLRLDGINNFHFSSAQGVLPMYALSAGKAVFVRGFHKSFDKRTSMSSYEHFQIVDFADTAWLKATEAGSDISGQEFGSIAAHIRREASRSKSSGGNGFGFGDAFETKEKKTKMGVGAMIETIVVRYGKPATR